MQTVGGSQAWKCTKWTDNKVQLPIFEKWTQHLHQAFNHSPTLDAAKIYAWAPQLCDNVTHRLEQISNLLFLLSYSAPSCSTSQSTEIASNSLLPQEQVHLTEGQCITTNKAKSNTDKSHTGDVFTLLPWQWQQSLWLICQPKSDYHFH